MLTAAVTALKRTDDAAGVIIVGGVVTLLAWALTPLWLAGVLFVSPVFLVATPVALAPWLVVRGYFVRVTRHAVDAGTAADAPPLVAWGELVRDGLKSVLLSAALLAPLAGGLAVVVGVAAALVAGPVAPTSVAADVESALGPNGPTVVAAVVGAAVAALVGAYLLAFAYVRPAALAVFAASGRLRSGLNPRRVVGVAATGPYATGWTLGVAALAVGTAVATPAIPLVVGVAVAFAVRVVAHGLYGRGAGRSMAGGPGDGRATGNPGPRSTDAPGRGDAEGDNGRDLADSGRGVSGRGPTADRGRDGPPTPVVSGDGGRPVRDEPPAAVQVGRAVPVDGDRDAGGDRSDADGGFEWGPALDDPEDKG
ncbi:MULTISPECIES: DUF4013 domain-containing protein [Halorubrum]|uniref:DUF4013 domain-containing protein n=1 Tax=Halorubrum hochstenium ATCC 700873 TaxID=1227481 RepID=M0FD45_9EURY|nr:MULTISPECIES: DUF4013 domain-containing protein [Halorubrum]ELZ57157.1 hypothetical protein C467_07030 [Halorubrum hochstenium ATCC 700873]